MAVADAIKCGTWDLDEWMTSTQPRQSSISSNIVGNHYVWLNLPQQPNM
jgi:hypothetical protein